MTIVFLIVDSWHRGKELSWVKTELLVRNWAENVQIWCFTSPSYPLILLKTPTQSGTLFCADLLQGPPLGPLIYETASVQSSSQYRLLHQCCNASHLKSESQTVFSRGFVSAACMWRDGGQWVLFCVSTLVEFGRTGCHSRGSLWSHIQGGRCTWESILLVHPLPPSCTAHLYCLSHITWTPCLLWSRLQN